MTAEEVATEVTKAWLGQLSGLGADTAETWIKKVYLASIEAYLEGQEKVEKDGRGPGATII